MIIVLKPNQKQEVIDSFVQKLTHNYDVQVNTWVGTQSTVLGLNGDTTAIDAEYIQAQDFVESVKRVQEPYKKANRKFHPTTRLSPCPAARKSAGEAWPSSPAPARWRVRSRSAMWPKR